MSKARHARPRRSTRRVARTLSIAGLGAGITAAGAGAAFATDYTVKSGDTLSEIAQANGADWHELAKINNLQDPDLILIGQTLSLDGVQKATAAAQGDRDEEGRDQEGPQDRTQGAHQPLRQPSLDEREHECRLAQGRAVRVRR